MASIFIEGITAEISKDEFVRITLDLGDEKVCGVMRRSSFRRHIEYGRYELDAADRSQNDQVINLRRDLPFSIGKHGS